MKKRKVVKSRRTHKVHHATRSNTKKLIYGMDPDFVLIVGGAFLIVVLGMMILYQ